jgi:hypothetical protein
MMTNQEPRFLHVANGTFTTRLIEAAGIPGAVSIWADPLHDGPVPAELSDADLVEVRARHLAGLATATRDATAAAAALSTVANHLRQWRTTIERHESYEELVLWFEHDLFDQLNLVQLLVWIRAHVPPPKIVSLVSIGSFPGQPRFKGLGDLTPGQLATLLDARQPVGPPQYRLAERAWSAFREPTPERLDGLRRTNMFALPFLAAALTRFVQEYPWTADGLSRTERRLLQLAGSGGVDLRTALPDMHTGEDAYFVTDTSLAALAADLCGTSPPLLAVASQATAADNGLAGSVSLTDAGRAVLSSERDRIETCGIDRWLGGVHLHGRANVWRWDAAEERVVRGEGCEGF